MRKHLLHWLLPLLMLLSQQGAVWHGIGHLTDARGHAPAGATVAHGTDAQDGQSHADADPLPVDPLCETCLAFDDLPSELDFAHQAYLLDVLAAQGAQILVTATEASPPLVARSGGAAVFHVEQGQVSAASGPA